MLSQLIIANDLANSMKKILLIIFTLFLINTLSAQEKVLLWKEVESMKKEKSCLYVYQPQKSIANGISVIICPGGSYAHLGGIAWEGFEVAKWLNEQGITAFVLRYRVGGKGYNHPAMIQDVQRAIQWVREHAGEYQINPDLLGVMGFSAGGHLSLMAGAFSQDNYLEDLGIKSATNLKPNFVVPVYPVVSMQDEIAHVRSRNNLLGKSFTEEKKDKFSMEKQMTSEMPPVFLVATKDDNVVNYQNSIVLKEALVQANILHDFVLYDVGGHGFGMQEKRGGEAAKWKYLFKKWLIENGFIE